MEDKILNMKMVSVTNRDNGGVTCRLSNNKRISFNIGETKKVPLDDLIELKSSDGGAAALREYLVINDKEALRILELSPEPEYFYTKTEIKQLLENGTLDQLEDCLNFAPEGVLDLLKDIALDMELPDTRKRKLISQKLGFNIDHILNTKELLNTEPEKENKTEEKVRKSAPITSEEPKRKSNPITTQPKSVYPEYKVVETKK